MNSKIPKKIVLGIGGSSGAIYSKRLLDKLTNLKDQFDELAIVISDNGRYNWELELGKPGLEDYGFEIYGKSDFTAGFASGSARYHIMIVCPCSMGLLGRMASGISNDLMTRAADVMLKERRKLIIVPRETPLNLVHIENMRKLTLAGAIICPAMPSFYSKPASVDAVVDTVVDRILSLAGIESGGYQWGEK